MKSITDYFQREKKSDSSRQKANSARNSFDEDEPSSDVWVLYSSGDEAEGSDNEGGHKKARLLVQLPQPILDLEVININKKRKRDFSDENIKTLSTDGGAKILNSSVHSVCEKDECSFYMSPLRLESDTSGVSTPCSAKTKISRTNFITASPVVTGTERKPVSCRSLFGSNCESSCVKKVDEKEERIHSDHKRTTDLDVGRTECLITNETSCTREDSNVHGSAVNERFGVASVANNELKVEKTSAFSGEVNDGSLIDILSVNNMIVSNSEKKYYEESKIVPQNEVINSAFNVIMFKSPKNASKERNDSFPVEVKKRTSDEITETFDDSPRKAKRRKSDISKNTLAYNQSAENQNNLYSYFLKKDFSKITETSHTIDQKDIFPEDEFEAQLIDQTTNQEQVRERSHSPLISVASRKVLKRKSETQVGTELNEELRRKEDDAPDLSLQKPISFINAGDGPSLDVLERRSSLRLKHKFEIKKAASVNSSEDEMPPILHGEDKDRKKFRKNSATKLAQQDDQKVACKSAGNSKRVKIKSSTADGEEIVVSMDSSSGESSKKVVIKEAYVKLAPLFLAKEELRKKQVFLQSGTPEVLKKKLQQQKQLEAELEERNEFPVISHILQCDHGLFPWNLSSKQALISYLPVREALPLSQHEVEVLTMKEKLHLGAVTDIHTLVANSLTLARPPNLMDVELDYDFNFASDKLDEYMPCFCLPQSPKDGTASEITPIDVEKFLRVSSWIMRTVLPPGVAYKMNVDLSSFLPAPSPNGLYPDHIAVLPADQSSTDLRRKMLLKIKDDYPGLPINRWFKNFYQKRKSFGGLCSYDNSDIEDSDSQTKSQQRRDTSSANSNADDSNVKHVKNCNDSHSSSPKSVTQSKSCSLPSGSCHAAGKKKLYQEKLSSESWTDIFSPRCFDDACILGKNIGSLNKLKDWLQKWKDRGSRAENKTKAQCYNADEDYSSGDEFCSSDDESGEDIKKSGKLPNVAIIIGECGSGKTSGVYATAKELNLKVLEINASSKRSGKNVLDAVKEATRSHQVNSSPLNSFLKNSGGKNSAKKPKNIGDKKIGEASGMSVIFVEDVDVVFHDRDDGFITALASLTSTSKRPFILEVHTAEPLKMGSNNNLLLQEALIRSSPHLNTLLAKQSKPPLLLPFQLTPKNLNAEALLRVICLCEGVWVTKQWCECIFRKTLGDFRHALQQAHFWAGSVARARVLHEGKARYSDDVLQDIKPARNIKFYQDNRIVANPCGCKQTYNCSYPYSWMFKDYIKQLWLNLDGIMNQAKEYAIMKSHPDCKGASNIKPIPSCETSFHNSKTDSSLLSLSSHKMVVSTMEIETNIRNGNICLTEGKELLSESLSNETKLIMSCSPKVKAAKGNKGRKKTSAISRLHVPDDTKLKTERENNGDDDIPKIKNEIEEAVHEVELQSHADMKTYFKILDLLGTCDVLLSKFENREGSELGKDMVFQMTTLPNVINLFMQAPLSKSSCEMKAKMQKTACTASQSQLILPLLPTNWVIRNKMLAHDVLPHIRETCRIQNELTAMGRGRTRHSCRHPTLRQFGPSLRDALCSTLVDNVTEISENNCV